MELNWLESLVFGLVSGLAEFLPVSAQAHRAILLKLFGSGQEDPLLRLLIHLGAFLAVIVASKPQIAQIRRERRLARIPKRRRKRQPDSKILLDLQIVRTVFVPSLLGLVIYAATGSWSGSLLSIAAFLLLNGLVLFLPAHLPAGNKDSRSMSGLDSLLIGLSAALGMIPGISRMGMTTSTAQIRGADKQQALTWSLLLSIPVLLCLMGLDIYGIASIGTEAFGGAVLFRFILSAAAAYCGGYIAIQFMRFLAVKAGFSGFAYYSWGAALFAFILYMTI